MQVIFILLVSVGLALGGVVPQREYQARLKIEGDVVTELAAKYGYPSESYQFQTNTGYLLTIHRIPYSPKCSADKTKGPVLLQHGLLSSSYDWLVSGPEKGLGFVLSDACYDVWMPNSRGNTHSKNHVSLNVDSDEFWDFSWHEMGVDDMPAIVDFILHKSGKPDLLYVGHSQGTTQFWIYASTYAEEAQSKVRAMFALAPVAILDDTQSLLLKTVAKFNTVIDWIMSMLGIREFLPTSQLLADAGGVLCSDQHPTGQALCANVLFILCGYDSEQLNATLLPDILLHTPAGAATKQVIHYSQSMNSGKFRQYDYGLIGNLARYGSINPPEYELSKIRVPIAFHYSRNDNFAALPDVEELFGKIGGNKIGKFLVPFDKFNHLDYLWAIDVKTLVYNQMLSLMGRY